LATSRGRGQQTCQPLVQAEQKRHERGVGAVVGLVGFAPFSKHGQRIVEVGQGGVGIARAASGTVNILEFEIVETSMKSPSTSTSA
jgi:hypothetical protein